MKQRSDKDGSRSFVEMNAGVIVYEGKPADLLSFWISMTEKDGGYFARE
jgi:hypothetical protein